MIRFLLAALLALSTSNAYAQAGCPAGVTVACFATLGDGPVAPGTPAGKSLLTGGIYNATLPTLTNGQQVAVQLDSSGRLIIIQNGQNSTLTVAQTVTASSAYTAGNAVGGLITLSNINRASGLSVFMQSIVVNSKSLQSAQLDLVFFNANPTGSTCTDKTAFSVATADAAKLVGAAHVSDWTASGLGSVGQMQQPPIGITPSGTAVYACMVTRGTPTFTATSDLTLIVSSVQN